MLEFNQKWQSKNNPLKEGNRLLNAYLDFKSEYGEYKKIVDHYIADGTFFSANEHFNHLHELCISHLNRLNDCGSQIKTFLDNVDISIRFILSCTLIVEDFSSDEFKQMFEEFTVNVSEFEEIYLYQLDCAKIIQTFRKQVEADLSNLASKISEQMTFTRFDFEDYKTLDSELKKRQIVKEFWGSIQPVLKTLMNQTSEKLDESGLENKINWLVKNTHSIRALTVNLNNFGKQDVALLNEHSEELRLAYSYAKNVFDFICHNSEWISYENDDIMVKFNKALRIVYGALQSINLQAIEEKLMDKCLAQNSADIWSLKNNPNQNFWPTRFSKVDRTTSGISFFTKSSHPQQKLSLSYDEVLANAQQKPSNKTNDNQQVPEFTFNSNAQSFTI